MFKHMIPDKATRVWSIGLLLCGLTLFGLGLLQPAPFARATEAQRGLSSTTNVTPFASATFTQTDSLPMPAYHPYSAVIDTANGFAYFGGYGAITKIRLSDFMLVGTLLLSRGE